MWQVQWGVALGWLVFAVAGCDAGEPAAPSAGSKASPDAGEDWDAAMGGTGSAYIAMVEGVDCARFRTDSQRPACPGGTLDEACELAHEGGAECPRQIGDPQAWACMGRLASQRTELVCNTCGGINVEQRAGFEGSTLSFSFSARGELLGIIHRVVDDRASAACARGDGVWGDACPASEDSAARAAYGLCPVTR